MNVQQMKDFVSERIDSVEKKEVNESLDNRSGMLLHFIPENLVTNNVLDWSDKDHQFNIKHSFRRLSGIDTEYSDLGDRVVAYTPHDEYYMCFKNGVIEAYKPVEIRNSLNAGYNFVKVDNLFNAIDNFVNASKIVHGKVYNSTPPYYIFISLLGMQNVYFASFDYKYMTTVPFPGKNVRFEPFQLNGLTEKIMPTIVSSVHYGMKSSSQWRPNS